MSADEVFHKLEALTEKHSWLKALDLQGMTHSPLKADLFDLLLVPLCIIETQSGGGALPCMILEMRQVSLS